MQKFALIVPVQPNLKNFPTNARPVSKPKMTMIFITIPQGVSAGFLEANRKKLIDLNKETEKIRGKIHVN